MELEVKTLGHKTIWIEAADHQLFLGHSLVQWVVGLAADPAPGNSTCTSWKGTLTVPFPPLGFLKYLVVVSRLSMPLHSSP